jgi:hypothetical protein
MNKIKKKNTHNIQVELDELRKVAVLIVEQEDLLLQLESKSIADFEKTINEKTGFTNPMASANAFGKEAEYKRLLELEGLVDGRLTSGDLTKSKDLKSAVISKIIEKHTIYFSESELALKTVLEKLMETFNNLNIEDRKQIGFTFQNELKYNPHSSLRDSK